MILTKPLGRTELIELSSINKVGLGLPLVVTLDQ